MRLAWWRPWQTVGTCGSSRRSALDEALMRRCCRRLEGKQMTDVWCMIETLGSLGKRWKGWKGIGDAQLILTSGPYRLSWKRMKTIMPLAFAFRSPDQIPELRRSTWKYGTRFLISIRNSGTPEGRQQKLHADVLHPESATRARRVAPA